MVKQTCLFIGGERFLPLCRDPGLNVRSGSQLPPFVSSIEHIKSHNLSLGPIAETGSLLQKNRRFSLAITSQTISVKTKGLCLSLRESWWGSRDRHLVGIAKLSIVHMRNTRAFIYESETYSNTITQNVGGPKIFLLWITTSQH